LTDNAVFTTVDGAPVFVASVPVNKLCFAVGIQLNGNFRTFATILRTCPGDAAAATAVALQWLGAGIPTSQVSIGASFSDGGFGLTSAGTAFDLVASTPVVLGPVINRAYVVTWLAAIKSAAGLAVAQAGGSPLEVSDNDAVGRLAKWLAAGLIRLDARPFNESDPNWIGSASARDWMTQTLLINPTDLGETLLRAENARLPWGAP
jgi:hypothetical protein